MEEFYSAIKTLAGIAILYFFCDMLVTSEKYKPYINLILGLAMISTVIKPVSALFKSETELFFGANIPSPSTDYRDAVERILSEHAGLSLDEYVCNILSDNFPQYSLTVRTYKHDSGTYRIYVAVKNSLTQAELAAVKNVICSKTGISADYVNIYLQDRKEKEASYE